MNALRKFATIAVLAAGFAGAAPRAEARWEQSWFPASVGSEWNYEIATPQGTVEQRKVTVDYLWISPNTGLPWYRFRNFNGDYHWLYQAPLGRVYEFPNLLWNRTQADVGGTWTVDTDPQLGTLACWDNAGGEIVSRTEQMNVPAGTFTCVHITYTTPCMDAGVTDEWYAPGVGLIRRDEETIMGPKVWALKSAKITGRQVGTPTPAATVRTTVATAQADYYENHMPVVGGGQRTAPVININTRIAPISGRQTVINFVDYNFWDITVTDASGNVVWHNPVNRIAAPVGGVNKTIPASGLTETFPFQPTWGALQPGTYTIKAQLRDRSGATAQSTATFTYGWAF